MTPIKGSVVALITPMDERSQVDFEALRRLVEWHVNAGSHGLVAVGTTGESATLSVQEHVQVIAKSVEYANGRLPVIAGTGANATQEAIELTTQAGQLGVDACLSVVPYYNKPTQSGLIAHFTAIADASTVPIILYNVPGRTVADLSNDSVVALMRHPNIVGIKDATGDVARGADLIERTRGHLSVYSGDDATALELMKAGAQGDISVTANAAPKLMSELCRSALSGAIEKAQSINERLMPLHRALFLEANPIPIKYAVSKLGYTSNTLRLPLVPLSDEHRKTVDEALLSASMPSL